MKRIPKAAGRGGGEDNESKREKKKKPCDIYHVSSAGWGVGRKEKMRKITKTAEGGGEEATNADERTSSK